MIEVENNSTLDPNILVSKSISGILDSLKYYVKENPLKIKFSNKFLNAFEAMLEIDKDLTSSKFEYLLSNFKSSEDEIKNLNTNIFKLQLRIILKKKTIIESECPDNPNIKSLVDIFNRKIEALLKIMEAQNDMEGDEKNPFENAFIQFKSTNETLDKKLIEITEIAKTSQKSLGSHKMTLEKIENKIEFLKKRNKPLIRTDIDEIIDKWTSFTNPVYRGAIDVLKRYEWHITESKKEEERLETSKEEQEQLVENYKKNFVDENLQKVKDFSKDVLKKYNDELENTTTKKKLLRAELSTIFEDLSQDTAINKFKEFKESDSDTCEKQFMKYLENKLNDFRNNLLAFNKVLSDEKRLEKIIQLLNSEEENVTSHFNEIFLEKITNESQKESFVECIDDIEQLIVRWEKDNTYPHFNMKVKNYLDNLKKFYENELKQITDIIDVPIKTGSNKIHPNNESYICDLKYVMLQKSENEQKIESQKKMIDQFSLIYDEREKEMKEILESLVLFDDTSTTELMEKVNRLVELKKEEEDLYKEYITFNDTLIELEQQKEILEGSEEFLKKMEDKEAKFGDAVSFIELYDLYRHIYTIFYNPLVLKCHILIIQGLMNDEIKSKMQRYVLLFYKPIDDFLYDDIKDTYDCTTDTKVFQLYENNINLTTSVSSIVLNDLMNERSENTFTYLKYVHFGMCMFTVLKQYFKKAETLPIPVFDLFKKWTENYSSSVLDSEIHRLYDDYIRNDERKCEFVLYEYCNTLFRDPMYRFLIKPSDYSDTYTNIQIDYYNTCEKIGYRNETYNRANAVRSLDQRYYQIAEHYMIDSKISKVYLHKDSTLSDLSTDTYFNKKMVEPLIDPSTNVTLLWKIMNIQTKSTRSNIHFLKQLIDKLIKIIENQQNHKETVLDDYFETDRKSVDTDNLSFSVTFRWKNTTSVSVLYVCDVIDAYKNTKTTFTREEEYSLKNEDNDTVLRTIKNHTLKYYSGINQLMDPCWSMSSLVRFDLPRPRNEYTNFGVHCDLNSRKYDYERLWIVFDTTDNVPSDTFRCPIPYIDTSFLKVLNDLSIVTTLFKNEENKLYNKKIQFFTDICNEQVFKKMQRLMNETEHNDSVLSDVYNDTRDLLENNIDKIIEKIETELNMKSALGLLFHVLGTTEDIIHFNDTTKPINSSRFEKSFLSLIRFFLNSM